MSDFWSTFSVGILTLGFTACVFDLIKYLRAHEAAKFILTNIEKDGLVSLRLNLAYLIITGHFDPDFIVKTPTSTRPVSNPRVAAAINVANGPQPDATVPK
jgi:hypothetical protein